VSSDFMKSFNLPKCLVCLMLSTSKQQQMHNWTSVQFNVV